MNWMLISETRDEKFRCVGVYATKEAANFIKRNKEGRKDGSRYEVIESNSNLRPESSWKVDKHLEHLSSKNQEPA
mgnify:CR=1 FL=1